MKKTLFVNFGLVMAMALGFSPSLMAQQPAQPHNTANRRPLLPDFVDAERIYDNFATFLKGIPADKKLNVATSAEAADQFELAKADIDKMVKAVETIKAYHKKVERFCTEDIEKFSSELMATFLSRFIDAAKTSVDGDEKKVSIKKEDVEAYAKLISQYLSKKATKFSDKKGEFEKDDKELLDSVKELAGLFKVDVSNPDAFRTADRRFGYGIDALERVEKDKKACYFKDEPVAQPPAKQDPPKKGNEPAPKDAPAAKDAGKGGPVLDPGQEKEEKDAVPGKKGGEEKQVQQQQQQPANKGLDLAALGQLMQKLVGDKINDLNKDFENALLDNQRKFDDLVKAQQDQQRLNDELARALKDANNNNGLGELAKALNQKNGKNGKDAAAAAPSSPSVPPSASITPPTGSSNIPPPPPPPPPPAAPVAAPMPAAPAPQDPVIETKKEDIYAQFNNRPRPVPPPTDPRTAGLLELARMQQQILFGPFGPMANGMAGAIRPGGGTTVANAVRGVGGGSVAGRTGVRPNGMTGGSFANGATPRSSTLPAALSQARM